MLCDVSRMPHEMYACSRRPCTVLGPESDGTAEIIPRVVEWSRVSNGASQGYKASRGQRNEQAIARVHDRYAPFVRMEAIYGRCIAGSSPKWERNHTSVEMPATLRATRAASAP